MTEWRFRSFDLLSGRVVAELQPVGDVTFEEQLCGAGGLRDLELRPAFGDLAEARRLRAATQPKKSGILIERDGTPRWSGVVWDRSTTPSALTLKVDGMWTFFRRQIVTSGYETGSATVEQCQIIVDVLAEMLDKRGAGIPVVFSVPDGPTVARQLNLQAYEFAKAAAVVEGIVGLSGGPEFGFQPEYAPDGTVQHRFTLHHPFKGGDTVVPVWFYGEGFGEPGSVLDYKHEEHGSDADQVQYAIGAGDGDLMLFYPNPAFDYYPAEDEAEGIVRTEEARSFKDISVPATLTARQEDLTDTYGQIGHTIEVEVDGARVGAWETGQIVVVTIFDLWHPGGFEIDGRIVAAETTLTAGGVERVAWTLEGDRSGGRSYDEPVASDPPVVDDAGMSEGPQGA